MSQATIDTTLSNREGVDNKGRFIIGNTLGAGSVPHSNAISRLRAVVYESATPLKMKRVMDALLIKAQDGDLRAIEIVMDRTLGKAMQHIEVTTHDSTPHQVLLQQISVIIDRQPELRDMLQGQVSTSVEHLPTATSSSDGDDSHV